MLVQQWPSTTFDGKSNGQIPGARQETLITTFTSPNSPLALAFISIHLAKHFWNQQWLSKSWPRKIWLILVQIGPEIIPNFKVGLKKILVADKTRPSQATSKVFLVLLIPNRIEWTNEIEKQWIDPASSGGWSSFRRKLWAEFKSCFLEVLLKKKSWQTLSNPWSQPGEFKPGLDFLLFLFLS